MTSRRARSFAMVTAAVLVTTWLRAQDASSQSQPGDSQDLSPPALGAPRQDTPRFRSSTDLVVLHVSVTDRKGAYVGDLPQEAFTVFEDGRAQQTTFFRREDEPLTAGLVIDSSGSLREIRDLVIAAGTAFVQAGNPSDEFFALAFNEDVKPALSANSPFTSNPEILRQAMLDAVVPRGRTALFDAIIEGLSYAQRGSRERKALVLISDGGDNASRATFGEVTARLQTSNVIVYGVALVDPEDQQAKPKRLKELAAASGGESFQPRDTRQVSRVLEHIARELRHVYTLGYSPAPAGEPRFHKLRVAVTAPGRGRLDVRTRTGYMSEPARPEAEHDR
ncbi:MAG: VWA domain-containing protein [Vicinamibacterales bacterium]